MAKRVCVIGGGSSGIAALRELRDLGFDTTAFEARPHVGGAWHFDADAQECVVSWDEPDLGWATVRCAKETGDDAEPSPPTAMYASLRTNVPTTLMAYRGRPFAPSTPLFPSPSQVQDYLEDAAADLLSHIQLNTRVTNLRWTTPADGGDQRKWHVEVTPTSPNGGGPRREQFDLVVIANGHYSKPFVPKIGGLEFWKGEIIHARWYRGPEAFKGKNVLVVGNSASGYDVTREIATDLYERRVAGDLTATEFIAQSGRSPSTSVLPFDRPGAPEYCKLIQLLPAIENFNDAARTVHFVDGSVLQNVDVVVFATGYLFSFPFADTSHAPFSTNPLTKQPLSGSKDAEGGLRVHNLDERQLFYLPDPTLALLIVHFNVIPFPLAQVEARLFGSHHANKVTLSFLPGLPEDEGESRESHVLGYPAEHDYTDSLLRDLGEGQDAWTQWCKIPQAHRDLRMGGKALRGAVLGY